METNMELKDTENNTDNFVSIFDIQDFEAEGKKNFYCKIKNYKTNDWEIVFYKRFIDCYIDTINRVYCDYYINKATNEFIIEKIKNYLHIGKPNHISRKYLSNGEVIEGCVSNEFKIDRLRFLLTIVGENMFFDFSNTEITDAVQFVKNKEVKDNGNVIKIQNVRYDIDKMNERECIELMILLQEKVSIELFDKQKAENRLKEIEEEKELQEIKSKIENSGLSKDQILKYLEHNA